MSRDLLSKPCWQTEDLGHPMPDSPYALSVCLPTWEDVVDYEEHHERMEHVLAVGYPRFVYQKPAMDLFEKAREQFAKEKEDCIAVSTKAAAERLVTYLEGNAGVRAKIHEWGNNDIYIVTFRKRATGVAAAYWQHTGDGVSSRQAVAALNGEDLPPAPEANTIIKQRIAAHSRATEDNIFLYSCGMNAIFHAHKAALALKPSAKSVQFGFPYVDSLKIQQQFGPGAHFFAKGDEADYVALEKLASQEELCAIITEFPSNPLLVTPDLERLSKLARAHNIPLIVDDTIACFANVDLFDYVDAVTSSLTKFFSGGGDVIAGSLMLNEASPLFEKLRSAVVAHDHDTLCPADARVLAENCDNFEKRVAQINQSAEAIADLLEAHPKVERVYYPKYQSKELYDKALKPGAGYSGLMSILLADPENHAPAFYDNLRLCKGPNLGTNFSLACPFTLLAHYHELDWAESLGVSRWIVRVSVGLEDQADLLERFTAALDAC